ncbi:TetR family transcriptional regulator [Mycolicibacterium insubricum]|jgi:AcrR family transcriptional regulator|uniref:TetR family transcriptional regulator n=1 Tax=Mycolicibacterium insubricum TaxID=444597 RepID=A0A1X0DGI2_9MYCO|nr:TetR/AcrR family transcriptional regulator [Mycolicibacterium insubricum]MCV7080157.1 TetR/AcrR family transcriptional regulator [Mycolicibacterium insubricum]ORA71302.1 TetR family transcriptional regulator [Mycolicibacterium insubricum]BBZ68091.1 TetR family transcriptional regulator [Mycolicibacterium insubricum]
MATSTVRRDRADATREAILAAAERLFAEDGIAAVSNRQISEAAGCGNNTAVGYHFGTKADLIRAIVRRHNEAVERICQQMVDGLGPDATLRDWVSALVYPLARYLTELGEPSWYARFSAQLMPDPAHRDIASAESLTSPAVLRMIEGLRGALPGFSEEVRVERNTMARHLIVAMFADRERAVAAGQPTPHADWDSTAAAVTDAITGMLSAPVSAAP